MTNRIFVVLIVFAISCSKSIELPNVDIANWKADHFGCNGGRLTESAKIIDQQDLLLGISSDDLAATLGKPDQVELYKRSQKFLIYYLDPAPICDNQSTGKKIRMMKVRVDALGRVKELFIIPYNE